MRAPREDQAALTLLSLYHAAQATIVIISYLLDGEVRGRRGQILNPATELEVLLNKAHEYAELSLALRVQEEILGFLTGKLEESKYREALDTPTLQVLDRATPPKTRSAPKRAMLTLACTAGALVLTTLLAFMLESWQRQREAQEGRMSAIREAWER